MFCKNCGKEIQNDVAFCNECGASQKETSNLNSSSNKQPVVQEKLFNKLSIIGFVVSLLPYLFDFFPNRPIDFKFYIFFIILGIFISAICWNICEKNDERGRGLAIAGVVLGVWFFGYWVGY